MDGAIFVNLVTLAQTEAKKVDFVDLVAHSSGLIMAVLVVLALFSVVSWYIIGYKAWALHRARRESAAFLETFWQSKRLDAIYEMSETMGGSPISKVFQAGYVELTKIKTGEAGATLSGHLGGIENIERALRRAANSEVTRLESLLPFLATTSSTSPFLGLFGTVLGIMSSFVNIGAKESVTLGTVAPGVAEALVTTAVGLIAAIPAVIAFNYFSARVRVLSSEMDSFSADFLNIIKRHFLK